MRVQSDHENRSFFCSTGHCGFVLCLSDLASDFFFWDPIDHSVLSYVRPSTCIIGTRVLQVWLTLVSFSICSEVGMVKQVPHGGTLVDLMLKSDDEKQAAIAKATVTIEASPRQLCDVELIMNGGFSPLTGFMDEATYKHVVENMELPDGTIFGLPVVFDTNDDNLQPGTTVLLTQGDRPIATVELTDKYVPNKALECKKCYGTSEIEHPGALMVATERGKYYMGGKVTGLNLPIREFPCKTPHEVRAELPADKDVVAFQCRNPVHRAHYELFTRALDDPLVGEGGVVLVHPTCGPTQVRQKKPGCTTVSI